MLQGSFRLFTKQLSLHFSFLEDGKRVLIYFDPACEGLISHQGQSVSINNLFSGINLTTSKFSSVFNELQFQI